MADRPRLKTPFDEDPPDPAAGPTTPPAARRGRRWRFGLGAIFGAMFLVAFAAAGFGAVMKGGRQHPYYVVFAMLAPFLALGFAALAQGLRRRVKRDPTESRDPWDDDPAR